MSHDGHKRVAKGTKKNVVRPADQVAHDIARGAAIGHPVPASSPSPQNTVALLRRRTAFRRALADWFARAQRPLPWRTTRSVYRTVVSEFMLQQTQVTTVLPYFARWMRALPDFRALAAAGEAQVLKLWEGLGYYRRARFLHQLARELAAREPTARATDDEGDAALRLPRTATEWRERPGIGPYTAAAIASISGGDPAACVDGNVVRILARLTGERRAFRDAAGAVQHFTPLAGALLDRRAPGRHNEAMMELGATVCLRRAPHCDECPVARFCAARRAGLVEELPRIARRPTEERSVDRIWLVRDGSLLLHRIPEQAARMRGLYELPTAEQAGRSARSLKPAHLLATHRRAITRYRITERIFRAAGAPRRLPRDAGLEWVPWTRLDALTLSGPHRRWIEALRARHGSEHGIRA